MFPSSLVPYLLGVLTAPLAGKVINPLARGTVKTTIGLVLQAKALFAQGSADLRQLTADVGAGIVAAAETGAASGGGAAGAKKGTPPAITAKPTV